MMTSVFTACSNDALNQLSDILMVTCTDGTIVFNEDHHEGFHGDGYCFIEVEFPNTEKDLIEEIKQSDAWMPLPLTENLNTAVYGSATRYRVTGPLVTDNKQAVLFPAIMNGYYFFLDRSSESTNNKDDTDLLSRYSYNFTVAIYDTDTHRLYYYELDT